jgi:hypothetical protein
MGLGPARLPAEANKTSESVVRKERPNHEIKKNNK